MPIYEYECTKCGARREVIQKFNDKPLKSCPECGGRMHKLISQSSFILKGTGWYVTDYASPDRKRAMESEGKPAPAAESKPSKKKQKKSKAAAKA